MLKEIYDELGIDKTPIALELEKYFELKKCKVRMKDGTRENGLEIIRSIN